MSNHTSEKDTPHKTRESPIVITERGDMALGKKFNKIEMSDARGITRARLLSRFLNEISTKKFGAVVFGYEKVLYDDAADHTMPLKEISVELERLLANKITVGIATRQSHQDVRAEIQHTIAPEYWNDTYITYCNGAYTSTLNDDVQSHNSKSKDLESFLEFAITNDIISKDDIIKYDNQISIKNHNNTYSAQKILSELRDKKLLEKIKVFESKKFVDIIPYHISKYHIVKTIKNAIPKDRHILCIGYDGQWPGSDCELLTHRYSLSTNTVSTTAASCWNLLPDGTHGEQGTISYLKSMHTKNNKMFNISI